MMLRRERADVEQLFNRVAARHERETTNRRITLTRHVDAAAKSIVGDADRLEQALQNLAANALRHTPERADPSDRGAVRAARSCSPSTTTVPAFRPNTCR